MLIKTSHNIEIGISTEYHDEYSKPEQQHFVFTYRIRLRNMNAKAIQIVSEHWQICESNLMKYPLNVQNISTEQPILKYQASYSYVAGCTLATSIGKIIGVYEVKDLESDEKFKVVVPEFTLIFPAQQN